MSSTRRRPSARPAKAIRVPLLGSLLACLLIGSATAFPAFAQQQEPPKTPPTTPVAPPANPANGPASDPLIGPIRKGDTLSVLVGGEPTLSGPQRVTAEGMIVLPLAGMVKVVGLMPNEASDAITTTFKDKKLIKNPQVVVTITGRPLPTVFVSGALERQGRIAVEETTRLQEVLEPSGIMPTSDLKRVVLIRGDKKIEINYGAYRTGNDTPDSPNNPLLLDGDKIYVYAQISVAGTIKVNGEVKTPQATTLVAGMTVVQAIQQAGGLTDIADSEKVVVLRSGQTLIVPYKDIIEGKSTKDMPLQDKDEIFVRRLEKPKVFHVTGGVPRGNTFPISGTVTLSDAIALAGGTVDKVDRKKITVLHKDAKGQVESKMYDLNKAADASTVIQPEDVISVPYPPVPRPKPSITEIVNTLLATVGLYHAIK